MTKVFAASVLFAAVTTTGAAQTAAPVARTPDGQPDIQGYWTEEPGGPEAVNVENGFQTADSLRVQGWTPAGFEVYEEACVEGTKGADKVGFSAR